MRVFKDMASLPAFRRAVVTVGSFDGVHRGHLFLLDILRERAAESGGESVVVTFGEHPRRVLGTGDELRMLTTPEEKAALLEAAGVDNLVVMPFDEGTARLSAEEFVRDFLVARLGMRELVVGYNHRLGRGREGDAGVLKELGAKYGFGVFCAPRFEDVAVGSGIHLGTEGKAGGGVRLATDGETGSARCEAGVGLGAHGGADEKTGSGVGGEADSAAHGGDGGGVRYEKISSTTIREALSRGDIEAAERMLGRKIWKFGNLEIWK